ncbi:MAG TPA: hypothetical protein VNJ70_00475 [Thermoanaerobaculia bacterium]|nr:hypothetical protein [Thermoanaerobaculia bacterium]
MANLSRLSVLLIACLLFACAGGARPGDGGGVQQAALGEDVTLAIGQRAVIDGGALEMRFDGVPEDSRCPVDVQCITAGNAVARLRLAAGGDAQTVELNTTVGPKEATHAGYTVQLVALRPEQTSGLRVTRGEYRAVLQVTKS